MSSHYRHLLSGTKSKYLKFKSRLEKNIASGRFDQLSRKKKNNLVSKVEKFRQQLENLGFSIRGAAVAGTVAAGAVLPNVANAQDQGVYFEKTGGIIPFPATTNDFVMANIDSDPELEIIVSTPTGGVILDGNVNDGFMSTSPTSLMRMNQQLFVGDIDGDTDEDIIFFDPVEDTYIFKVINDGNGNFTSTQIGYTGVEHIQIVDWDSDGDLDVVTSRDNQYLEILVNDGSGNFADFGVDIDLQQSDVTGFEFADMDGDGDMDLVHVMRYAMGIPYDGNIVVLENTTDGPGAPTLDPTSPNIAKYINYTALDGITTFDMDGDGDLDIFFHRQGSPYSYASRNNSTEGAPFTFTDINVGYLNSAGSLQDAVVADFDNDGDDDLIVTGSSFTKLLRFDGTDLSSIDGDLLGEVSNVGDYFSSLNVGDLDGDGHVDVLGVIDGGNEYAYIDVSGAQRMVIGAIDFSERKTEALADIGGLVAFDKNDADIGITDGGTVFSFVSGNGTNDADNSKFTISGSANTARLAVGATALDFETQSEYRIRINTLASGVNRAFDFVLQLQDSPEAGFGTFEAIDSEVYGDQMYSASMADIDGDGDDDLIYKRGYGNATISVQTDLTEGSGTSVAYGDIVLVTDFDNDGDQDIVTNNGTDVYIYLNDGAGGFGDSYGNRLGDFGADVYDIAVADFDGDGDQDIIIAKSYGGEIWSNDGDRTFTRVHNTGNTGDQVEVGDFDGDGRFDFVMSNDGYIYNYHNDGTTFTGGYVDASDVVSDMVVADFDNDGNLDILVAGDGELRWHQGYGDGTFDTYVSSITPLASSSGMTVGDIDGDNDLDLIIATSASRSAAPIIEVLENDGQYFYEIQSFETLDSSFGDVVLGDVDGDDDLDFVLSGGESRQVFENDNLAPSIAGFSKSVIIDENTPSYTSLGQIQVIDENSDSIEPLVLHDGTNDNSIFQMDVDGNLTLASELDWEELGSDLLLQLDLSDDQGNTRVGELTFKINNLIEGGNGTFDSEEIKLFGSQTATFFKPGDYDMDGDADLFKSTNTASGGEGGQVIGIDVLEEKGKKPPSDSSNPNSIFQQNSGSFSDEPLTFIGGESQVMAFVDVDNDGDLDLVTHSGNDNLYLSINENGEFLSDESFGSAINHVEEIVVGDFDNDGLIEIAVHFEQFNSFNYYGVRTFEYDPDDGFVQRQNLYMYNGSDVPASLVTGDFEDMAIADFTGNGYADLLVVTAGADDMLFEGSDLGFSTTPTAAITEADYGDSWSLFGDIDGDSDPDVLIVRGTLADDQMEIDVHLNDGTGGFTINQTISNAGQYFEDLQLGDVDGDGSLDLVTASFKYSGATVGDYNLEISLNDGEGYFTLSQTITDANAETIVLMDVDSDDDLDIVLRKDTEGEDNNLLFAIKNENVAPTAINLSASAFDEHLGFEEEIATMTVDDLNPGDSHVISLVTGDGTNDEHNSFVSISGNSLRITQDVSFEDTPTLNILLSVYDGFQTFEQAIVLTVNDVNQAPTGINLSVTVFDEGTQPGTSIATISAVDANTGDTHHFELATGDGTNDADNGSFVIDGDQLVIIDESNFETKASYNIYLFAEDDEGGVEAAFTITVNDVNQLPTAIALSSTSFDEGVALGSEIATISAVDSNSGDEHTFEFATGDGSNDADNGSFVIDGNKLIITTDSKFEDKAAYNIYLSASDADGSVEEAIVLNVNDINQAPTGITLSASAFDEGTAPGSSVATIAAVDANTGDTHIFTLATGDGANDADNGSFLIDGSNLVITENTNAETQSTYNIFLAAADSQGAIQQAFVVTITDVNQAPTGIILSTDTFDEGTAPGTSIATLSAVDANSGDTHEFALVAGDGTNDADNGSFVVSGNSLIVTAATEFDTQASYNVYLSASDDEGSTEQAFVLTITEVVDSNQAPTDILLSAISFDEGTAPGTVIATLSAADADAGDTHTFELVSGDGTNDADNSSFIVNGNSLIVTTNSKFETQSSYNVYLSTSDGKGSFEKGFLLGVNDLNQAPSGISLSSTSLNEKLQVGTTVATVSVTDPNEGDSHTLSLASGDGTNDEHNDLFLLSGSSLILVGDVNFDVTQSLNILITANDGEDSFSQAFTLTVNDVLGLQDEIENSLGIYPNPGNDRLEIKLDNDLRGHMGIKISDLAGKLVHAYESEKVNNAWVDRIDMTSAQPGVYIVEILFDNKQLTQRWIKE